MYNIMCEVYKIQNNLNGKIYIGITIQGARTRFLHHLYEARSGSSFPIHRSINKYGKDNFTIETIELCDSTEQMKEREKYWISFYNTMDRSNGYNRTYGGDGTFGRSHSDETKEKIRKKAIGRKASDLTRSRMSVSSISSKNKQVRINSVIKANKLRTKCVLQYDLNMNLICEYPSIKIASESTCMNRGSISNCIKRNKEVPGINQKFIWRLKDTLIMDVRD